MTTPIAAEIVRRGGRPRKEPEPYRDLFGELAFELRQQADQELVEIELKNWSWPSDRYRKNPRLFAEEVLGITPWSRQIEILEAIRDYPRVAVSSGHKVSKSNSIAIASLWWFCSFDDARVVLTSTTSRQVDAILWREIRKIRANAPHPIAGDMHELARSGFKADDFREIVGFTAREAEAVAGVSGKNLLYLADEASGIPDPIFEAIEGNRAGGAKLAMFSNPTKNEGEHFEAFHAKKAFYFTITISSEESPNVVTGSVVVPGLCERAWVEEKKAEHGEDSPYYQIRVRGLHALGDDGKIISAAVIADAENRWPDTVGEGQLWIGLDPAGEGEGGDESVWAPRRGNKILELFPKRGLSEHAHLAHTLAIIQTHKLPNEKDLPVVVLDSEGEIGTKVRRVFEDHVARHPRDFILGLVRSSENAVRQPKVYDKIRDELFACLAQWLRAGGAIPEDTKLSKELHVPEWYQNVRGRLKVTEKKVLRKILGRSPDRADAVQLAVWEPASVRYAGAGAPTPAAPGDDKDAALDPYHVDDANEGGGFDPFGGG